MISADLSIALPEILLALFAMTALMVGVFAGQDRVAPMVLWATSAAFVLLALMIALQGTEARTAFGGMFIDDPFARFTKVMILLSAAVVMLMGQDYMLRHGLLRFEYPVLVALAVVGMMIMVSAGDLMALYMGLELQSLALYVIVAIRRDSARSTEAGLKYFMLGALASGMLLYGASLVYGFAGTTQFAGIISTIADGEMPLGLLIGLAFLIAGLAFKVSAVPFHMWTPDVYQGAPTPVTAFLSTAPKVAAIALFARVGFEAFGTVTADWGQIVALLAVLSMFLGGVAAIGQRDIKRLMAYSSIAHMGYALVGLAAGSQQGVEAMLIYMAIYVTMNIGVFAFVLSMSRDGRPVTDIGALNMLSAREPIKAAALLVLLFSMAGVPPLLGFFAKLAVLWAAVEAGMAWLAVAGVIASVIGAFYYLRIVYYMYFGEEVEELDRVMPNLQWGLLMASAVIMVVGVVNLFGIESFAEAAAQTLVR